MEVAMLQGQHRGINVGLSQQPASVNTNFIGNSIDVYASRLTYDRDWRALASKFGKDAEKLAVLADWTLQHWKG